MFPAAEDCCFGKFDNLVNLITSHAAVAPGRPAIVEGNCIVSYSALNRQIAQYAGFLKELGLQPKGRLALVLHDNSDHLMLILAAASLGAAALSINWRGKVEEKRAVIESFAVDLVIHEPRVRVPGHFRTFPLDDVWRRGAANASAAMPNPEARDLPFRILLTSGSTGAPKGCELTHSGAVGWCVAVREGLALQTGQRHLSALPLAFTGSLVFNLPQLLCGNTIELFPPIFTAEEFIAAVSAGSVNGFVAVRSLLRQMMRIARDRQIPLFPDLNYVVSLGAPLSADERRAARELLTPFFYDNYGASGAGPITFLAPADIEMHADSIGRAAALREVEVVDEDDHPLPRGEIGRLRCRGVGVADCFCNDTAEGASESFRNGWYYPGEIAQIDDDGYIRLVARASDLILRDGRNVYPAEIEQVLTRHPSVHEAAVIGVPFQGKDEQIVAFVEVSRPTSGRELLELCRRNLVSYKVPDRIAVVKEFPRTAAGKILKSELGLHPALDSSEGPA